MPTTTSFNAEKLKGRLLTIFNDKVICFYPLNITVVLYGNENWNTEANMVLFRAVHRYMHAPKHF